MPGALALPGSERNGAGEVAVPVSGIGFTTWLLGDTDNLVAVNAGTEQARRAAPESERLDMGISGDKPFPSRGTYAERAPVTARPSGDE
jgi:hypothetical protein